MMSVLTLFSAETNQGTRQKYEFPSHPAGATNSPEGEKQTVLSKDALAGIDPFGEREDSESEFQQRPSNRRCPTPFAAVR